MRLNGPLDCFALSHRLSRVLPPPSLVTGAGLPAPRPIVVKTSSSSPPMSVAPLGASSASSIKNAPANSA
eukprot:scaffold43507_cov56-Phaeocystis_antarctica.AAC.2